MTNFINYGNIIEFIFVVLTPKALMHTIVSISLENDVYDEY